MSGRFARADREGSFVLGTTIRGTFGSSYSHHSGLSFDMLSDDGFSPMFADLGNGVSLGAQYFKRGFFIASAYTERPDFFGITDGYDDVTSFDLNVGHRYFYLRASRQEAEGDLIHSVEGTSIGATIEKHFNLKNVGLDLSIQGDCFLGGSADTVFGNIEIQDGGCNKRADINIDTHLTPKTSIELGLGEDQLGLGKRDSQG